MNFIYCWMQFCVVLWPRLLDSGVILRVLRVLGSVELMEMTWGRGLSSQLTQKRKRPLGTLVIVCFGAEITQWDFFGTQWFLFLDTNLSEEKVRHWEQRGWRRGLGEWHLPPLMQMGRYIRRGRILTRPAPGVSSPVGGFLKLPHSQQYQHLY